MNSTAQKREAFDASVRDANKTYATQQSPNNVRAGRLFRLSGFRWFPALRVLIITVVPCERLRQLKEQLNTAMLEEIHAIHHLHPGYKRSKVREKKSSGQASQA